MINSETNKLFCIAIPTYNRAELLSKSLAAICSACKEWTDDICVYVSDNSSEDNTGDVVKKYQEQYPNLICYYRQKKNIGGPKNFRDAAFRVKSKYLALVGDDDILMPTFFETLMGLIKHYSDVALFNFNVLSFTEKNQYMGTRDPLVVDEHVAIYNSGGQFLETHMIVPSLMTSNVFLREPFVECLKSINIEEYPGYEWYYALMISVLDKRCIYYDFPLILQRQPLGANVRWMKIAPLYHIYGFGHMFRSLDAKVAGIENKWKEFFIKDKGTADYLLYIISQNRNFYKDKYKLLKEFSPNRKYTFKMTLYTFLPYRLTSMVLWLTYKINRIIKLIVK